MTETARTERAKAVSYLRREVEDISGLGEMSDFADGLDYAAAKFRTLIDNLEAGLHLKKPEPSILASEWRDVPSAR